MFNLFLLLLLTDVCLIHADEQACQGDACPPMVNSMLQTSGRSTDLELSTVEGVTQASPYVIKVGEPGCTNAIQTEQDCRDAYDQELVVDGAGTQRIRLSQITDKFMVVDQDYLPPGCLAINTETNTVDRRRMMRWNTNVDGGVYKRRRNFLGKSICQAATAAVTASYVSSAGFCKDSVTNWNAPHCKFGPNHKYGSGFGTLTDCEAECTKMTSCIGWTANKDSYLHADGAWCHLHVPEADCILMDDVKADGSFEKNVMDNGRPTLGWPQGYSADGSISGLTQPGDTTQPLSDTGYNCYIKASGPQYKTNPDESVYYNKCEDPAYEPITTEAECKQMVTDFIPGGNFVRTDSKAHWPPGCWRVSWNNNVYLNTNKEGTGDATHLMVCKRKD